ncbi:MAG: hypothetical protein U9N84_09065, partial [Actinomycetota bacterium]|nr:hypothetical protein [Actinomycetota bacterium]
TLSRWEKSELGKDLRRLGLSYGEIMDLIPVKKSTLATWCRDVDLTKEQIEAIRQRQAPIPGIPVDTNWRRRAEIRELRAVARSLVPDLADDPLWIAGLILYWAEGNKTRNKVGMANTDPRALRLFLRWLCTYVQPTADFSLQLHLHEGNDDDAAQAYWREETGLSDANFHKTFIKPKGTGHRKNHLKHGVCTIRMRRPADAWNIIMEWIDALAEQLDLQAASR